jgi:hypothetical protein
VVCLDILERIKPESVVNPSLFLLTLVFPTGEQIFSNAPPGPVFSAEEPMGATDVDIAIRLVALRTDSKIVRVPIDYFFAFFAKPFGLEDEFAKLRLAWTRHMTVNYRVILNNHFIVRVNFGNKGNRSGSVPVNRTAGFTPPQKAVLGERNQSVDNLSLQYCAILDICSHKVLLFEYQALLRYSQSGLQAQF